MNSTAKGEIAYARYVYAHTHKDDAAIRAPVANFWATRSHTLRAEAEDEFRQLCLEFPQFGYDVLSMSLCSPFLSLPLSPSLLSRTIIIRTTTLTTTQTARVLDEKLKREKTEKMHPSHTPSSSRKRPRQSGI